MPVAIQLAHAGRKGSSARPWEGGMLIPLAQGGWTPVAPSAVPHARRRGRAAGARRRGPRGGARRVRGRGAARRAQRHRRARAAHGARLPAARVPVAAREPARRCLWRRASTTASAFRSRSSTRCARPGPPTRPLGVRVSATDWVDGGWTLEESVELARQLKARGCDWIDVSSGGVSPAQRIPAPSPGVHVPFAREIRRATGIDDDGGRPHHRARSTRTRSSRPATPTWSRSPAPFCAIRAGRGARRPLSAATVAGAPQYWRALTKEMAGIFGELRAGQR